MTTLSPVSPAALKQFQDRMRDALLSVSITRSLIKFILFASIAMSTVGFAVLLLEDSTPLIGWLPLGLVVCAGVYIVLQQYVFTATEARLNYIYHHLDSRLKHPQELGPECDTLAIANACKNKAMPVELLLCNIALGLFALNFLGLNFAVTLIMIILPIVALQCADWTFNTSLEAIKTAAGLYFSQEDTDV